ncbi:amidohydrolase family protein [Priestia megaterium]|nr:amidohydrolase family protein [Priestia megaterium]
MSTCEKIGGVSVLHLINVRLPIMHDHALFEVKISDGMYTSIVLQNGYLEDDDFIPLHAEILGRETFLDVQGRVLLPGFVDMHMHLDKAHSLPQVPNISGTLREAVENYSASILSFPEEELRQRMLKTALQALANGTTTIRTHIDFNCSLDEDVLFRGIQAAVEVRDELSPYMDIQVVPLFSSINPNDDLVMKKIKRAIDMEIDAIGGCPHLAPNPKLEIDTLFSLAKSYNKPLDLHVDESDDPNVDTIIYIAEKTLDYRMQRKVVVGHLCSLAGMDEGKVQKILTLIKKAEMGVVTLPAANLYLQGRQDKGIVRRGVTRIREIQDAAIPIATASDNVHDPFHPFGKADLLQIGLLTGYVAHMGSPSEQRQLLRMITSIPARLIGKMKYGVEEGNAANFVLLNVQSVEEIWTEIPETRFVFAKHRWVSVKETHQRLADNNLTALWQENQILIG